MCKLAFLKTNDGSAYRESIKMIQHQESVVAGHSTGFVFRRTDGKYEVRKSIGKIINYMAKYPDIPKSNSVLSHSRYATVSGINLDNQHPINITLNGKVIGYVIHNGSWSAYQDYEYMRNPNVKNKTDSALAVAIYTDILKKKGNTPMGRKRALATLKGIVDGGTPYQNFIIMFTDGQVLFAGEVLTYNAKPGRVGIMTFGLPNAVEKNIVYEVRDFNVVSSSFNPYEDYKLEARPPRRIEPMNFGCGGLQGIPPERRIDEATGTQEQREKDKQTTLSDFRMIEGKRYRLHRVFLDARSARKLGERLKKAEGYSYRVLDDFKDGRARLYVRKGRFS